MLKLTSVLFASSCLFLSACSTQGDPERERKIEKDTVALTQSPPKLFKVAFVGDSGFDHDFRKVLKLIKREQADLVLHLGDLAYDTHKNAPAQFDRKITEILGRDFPYLFTVGNHDLENWNQKNAPSYSDFLRKRLLANKNIKCIGEDGVKSLCTYNGLYFVLSGIGVLGNKHEEFIEDALKKAKDYSWRVCAWHKNQREMQAGTKSDEVGWDPYRLCQKYGAIIATGHEHSYARSRTLQDLGNSEKNHGATGDASNLKLDHGSTFVFVSGLGGHSLRPFDCSLHHSHNWWGSVFTNNFYMEKGVIKYSECDEDDRALRTLRTKPDYDFGALFVSFHYQDDPRLAKAEFKTVDNTVIDEFLIRTKL